MFSTAAIKAAREGLGTRLVGVLLAVSMFQPRPDAEIVSLSSCTGTTINSWKTTDLLVAS